MQEAFHEVHHHEHGERNGHEYVEAEEEHNNTSTINEARNQTLIKEDLGQLRVSK